MKKVLLLALLVLASASAEAQDYLYGLPMYRGPVSAMGTCEAAKPRLWVTTDSTAAGNCAAGSGSAEVLCLCSGGAWAAVGASGTVPQHVQDYSPDRAPAGCYACEEFTDGELSQTWAWGNQASATETLELDAAKINFSGATGPTVRVLAIPGATDWTATVKYRVGLSDTIFLWILHTGTLASPTSIVELTNDWQGGTTGFRFLAMTLTGYDTWSSTDFFSNNFAFAQGEVWLQARYTASTKVVAWYWSWDGMTWSAVGTKTLTSHPSYVGRGTRSSDSGVHADYFRIRTDANRNLAGE